MAGGGGGAPTQQNVTTTTTNLPEYARPYFENLLSRAQAESYKEYTPYPYERTAGFTPAQEQIQQNILGMQGPGQFATGSGLAAAAGLGSLGAADYTPAQFSAQQIGLPELQQYRMTAPQDIAAQTYAAPSMQVAQTGYAPELTAPEIGAVGGITGAGVSAPTMQAAQTGYRPDLKTFQLEGEAGEFGGVEAQKYMSPYMQSVVDIQKREAITDAQKAQLAKNLGAAREGTYGGARQLLATTERERALGQQLGDIQARGLQAAYENAQSQYERDRAARMGYAQQNFAAKLGVQELGAQQAMQTAFANLSNEQQARVNNQATEFQARGMTAENAMRAALANQGVDLARAQANQQAQLATQQLRTETGLRTALANLDAQSQANVQNLAAQLQTQGMNAENALRAALANQSAALTTGQQNLQSALQTQQLGTTAGLQGLQSNQQAALEAQRLAEQSRQFGATTGLAGLAQAGQMAQTLGNLGQLQQQSDLQRLQAQQAAAGQAQAMEQQRLDQLYADFLRQRDFPTEQLSYFSNILRGIPFQMGSTQTTYAPPPSMASQVLGAGVGGLGLYNTMRG